MNGRAYDPELGRFTGADPILQSPFFSQGLNAYSYVQNSPLAYTVPSGFMICNGGGPADCPPGARLPNPGHLPWPDPGSARGWTFTFSASWFPGAPRTFFMPWWYRAAIAAASRPATVGRIPGHINSAYAAILNSPIILAFEGAGVRGRSYDLAIERGDISVDQAATYQNKCRYEGGACVATAVGEVAAELGGGWVITKAGRIARIIPKVARGSDDAAGVSDDVVRVSDDVPSAGPLKNASGNLDDAATAARTQRHNTPNITQHARERMEGSRDGRTISMDRVQEAIDRGTVTGTPGSPVVERTISAADSASGRVLTVIEDVRTNNVITVIDKGSQ